ncbi:hypothetical protein M728_005724 (plasmid) [Ensifer sp. WSM1721]
MSGRRRHGNGEEPSGRRDCRALIRNGGRFFNVIALVNRLETETHSGKQGQTADDPNRLDFIILDNSAICHLPRQAANSCSI